MKNGNKESNACCPKFDPDLWNEKTHNWEEKLFIRDTVKQLFHRPLPISIKRTIGRMWQKAQDAKADPDIKDFLLLAYDPSPWKSELYMTVTKEIPGAKNVKLSGIYLSKVFDGPYNAVPKWIKEMEKYVSSKGKKTKKYFFYFTTCPKCAKIYEHNYAVAFAQVE
ncbi:hydrolase [Halobacteriota archaeon]